MADRSGELYGKYSEKEVFRGPTRVKESNELPRYRPARLQVPVSMPQWINNTSGNNGSVKGLSENLQRASLIIQNFSATATLYFTFGSDASNISANGLGPGKGIILDTICPQSALYLFMDSSTLEQCTVTEISYE